MYARQSIPESAALLQDCKEALGLLSKVYRQVELGRAPQSLTPEEAEVAKATEEVARPNSTFMAQTGQAIGLSPRERRLVEDRAMHVASEWLTENGFEWRDVHKKKPYDFEASKSGDQYIVEVKGTTGAPSSVILTKNEVQVHREQFPLNMLLVVHGIELSLDRQRAGGGLLHPLNPWEIADSRLEPLSFRYAL
jgi:ATP-dependent phosphoenolpyruvate carboxykinase